MTRLTGFLGCLAASLCFGSNYVPVKKHPIYDGLVFQWFQCSGIFFICCLQALYTQNWNNNNSFEWNNNNNNNNNICGFYISWYGLIGGCLWSCANTLAAPVVKYLGLNIAFVIWNVINIITAYSILEFNWIDSSINNNNNQPVSKWQTTNMALNIGGIGVAIVSLFGLWLLSPSETTTSTHIGRHSNRHYPQHQHSSYSHNYYKEQQQQQQQQHQYQHQHHQPHQQQNQHQQQLQQQKQKQQYQQQHRYHSKHSYNKLPNQYDMEQEQEQDNDSEIDHEYKCVPPKNEPFKPVTPFHQAHVSVRDQESDSEKDSSTERNRQKRLSKTKYDVNVDKQILLAEEFSPSNPRKSNSKNGKKQSSFYSSIPQQGKGMVEKKYIVKDSSSKGSDNESDNETDTLAEAEARAALDEEDKHSTDPIYEYHNYVRITHRRAMDSKQLKRGRTKSVEYLPANTNNNYSQNGQNGQNGQNDQNNDNNNDHDSKDIESSNNKKSHGLHSSISSTSKALLIVTKQDVHESSQVINVTRDDYDDDDMLIVSQTSMSRPLPLVMAVEEKKKNSFKPQTQQQNQPRPHKEESKHQLPKQKSEYKDTSKLEKDRVEEYVRDDWNNTFTNSCSNYLDFNNIARQIMLERWDKQLETREEMNQMESYASRQRQQHQQQHQQQQMMSKSILYSKSKWLGLFLCLLMGLCMGNCLTPFLLWQSAYTNHFGDNEKPKSLAFMFSQCLGIYLSSTIIFLSKGLYSRIIKDKLNRPVMRPAIISGMIWSLGFMGQLYAVNNLPYIVAYPICTIGPVFISTLWSFFYFNEIRGYNNMRVLICSMIGIAMAIALLGLSV